VVNDTGCPTFFQHVLAAFIQSGDFDRHLRRARRRNARRRSALIEALTAVVDEPHRVEGANAGLHLVLALPNRAEGEAPALLRRLEDSGVIVRNLSDHAEAPLSCLKLMFGYATLEVDSIRRGIELFGRVLHETN
jgi:GntR family transcriptional regulator/MocR family aminotransferase